jgi:toxin HigB-1
MPFPKFSGQVIPLFDNGLAAMIRSFRHKGLKGLFETGASPGIRPDLQARALRRLDALDRAMALTDLSVPGFDFHRLRGQPTRYSLHVNGPWCPSSGSTARRGG